MVRATRTEAAIMVLDTIFTPFLQQRPVCVLARATLERLFDPTRLNALFDRTATTGYTRKVHFATLVGLMGDVVLGVRPSVHAAFRAQDEDTQAASLTAIYRKLDRLEPAVSAGLVRDSAEQAAPTIAALRARFPPWLCGYHCRILDGSHPAATQHRIAQLRTTWAAPLPGHALVVLDPQTMLVTNIIPFEDGHAQERSGLGEVLALVCKRDVWIADRMFCTRAFLTGIAERSGFFVIRQHGSLAVRAIGRRRARGRTETGRVYEQGVEWTDPETQRAVRLRRVTVVLDTPTRDGECELHVLTNLPAADADTRAVAELYRKRWTVEAAFQELSATLDGEIATLGYPRAALFGLALALAAYNAVSLVKAALRAAHGAGAVTGTVSGYFLALEIRGTYDGMMVAIPDEHWAEFGRLDAGEFARVLKDMAGHVRLTRYRKHPRGPKKPPPPKSRYRNGGHVSTFRLLNPNT
jgi:hypothetical protein